MTRPIESWKRGDRAREAARESRHPLGDDVYREGDQNWKVPCEVCGGKPTVHPTDLCGPCCFGEAETVGGNW